MTDQPLSPATEAVLDAYANAIKANPHGRWCEDAIAAALRAAVDQVLPIQTEIIDNCWYEAPNSLRDQFLEIATELENQ